MKLSLLGAAIFRMVAFVSVNSIWAANNTLPDSESSNKPASDAILDNRLKRQVVKAKKNVIYQWVDENGNTVISDKPHEGAIEIEVPKPQTYNSTLNPSEQRLLQKTIPVEQSKPRVIYNTTPPELNIVIPANDSWLENNIGDLQVNISIKPSLRLGQVLLIKLDDKEISRGLNTSVSKTGLDRGTHNLLVEVVMKDSGKVIAEKHIRFHVRRPIAR